MLLDPQDCYVRLGADGVAEPLAGGDAFWSLPHAELDRLGGDWLISEFEFSADWPSWEMHPNGDEFVYLPTAFAPQSIAHGFGQTLAERGLTQLRIAETEKYAHVTYFFNGGVEAIYPGEDRILVPSPKVATYDLKPEMSAFEVTDKLVEAIESGRYDAIVCNYANGDMVGHTGDFDAARKAVEALDVCIGRVVDAARAAGGEVVITADHGNAEMMHDPATGQAHTAHTLNLVPLLYVGRPATVMAGGALSDVAPTLLALMGLPQPREMTGHSLVRF